MQAITFNHFCYNLNNKEPQLLYPKCTMSAMGGDNFRSTQHLANFGYGGPALCNTGSLRRTGRAQNGCQGLTKNVTDLHCTLASSVHTVSLSSSTWTQPPPKVKRTRQGRMAWATKQHRQPR